MQLKQAFCPINATNIFGIKILFIQYFIFKVHFSFTGRATVEYTIPVTFTTNQQQNYDDVYPTMMIKNAVQITLPNTLDEDDYVIFNIQGQGYFSLN